MFYLIAVFFFFFDELLIVLDKNYNFVLEVMSLVTINFFYMIFLSIIFSLFISDKNDMSNYLICKFIFIMCFRCFTKFFFLIKGWLKIFFLNLKKDLIWLWRIFLTGWVYLQSFFSLWKPLIKRWSYFGLFSKTRVFWKNWKNPKIK